MPDRVLRQFGYEQRIPDTVLRYNGGVFEDIDYDEVLVRELYIHVVREQCVAGGHDPYCYLYLMLYY